MIHFLIIMTAENLEGFNFQRADALNWVATVEDVMGINGEPIITDYKLIFGLGRGAAWVYTENIRIEVLPEMGFHTDHTFVDYPLGMREDRLAGSAIIAAARPEILRRALHNQPELLRRFGLLEEAALDQEETLATT